MINKIVLEVVARLIIEVMSQWEQWWPLIPVPF